MSNSRFKTQLLKYQLLALDTNIFIYQFQKHSQFSVLTVQIIECLEQQKNHAITSQISILEVLSFPKLVGQEGLIAQYKQFFSELPNFEVKKIDISVIDEAARLRRIYQIRTPDAIQLATAIVYQADIFITNDDRLKKMKEIKILELKSMI